MDVDGLRGWGSFADNANVLGKLATLSPRVEL